MNAKQHNSPYNNLTDRLAQSSLRALAGAGIRNLVKLAHFREADIRQLHGIGPDALVKLRSALA